MRDEYRARSPDRGRHRSVFCEGGSRGSDKQHQYDRHDRHDRHGSHDDHFRSRHDYRVLQANLPTGHRDYSRSPPPRQNFYDHHQRERVPYDSRQGIDSTSDYNEGHHGSDDGFRRRHGSPQRYPSRYDRDDRDDRHPSYDDIYDDARRGRSRNHGRYDDDEPNEIHSTYSDSRRGRSRSPRGRYRSRSRSRTRDAGKPTDTVILEGLPHNMSTSELREALLAGSIAAELPSFDVRLPTSRGNRRAFVQFQDIGHAQAFVKEHFPKLLLELRHSTDDAPDGSFEAYIHYARNRDDGDSRPSRASDWNCPQCDYSNFSSRSSCKVCGAAQSATTAPPSWEQSLTGAADAAEGADATSQILVIYPLASFVTEELLAKELKSLEKTEEPKPSSSGPAKLKSTAPGADASRFGAKPHSLHRVFLMRDVGTGESFKYGFAEFWTLDDAMAAVTKFRMSRSFTVAGCAVSIAPTHMGVFLPEERHLAPKIEHMSFQPLFNPSLRVRYRDLHVFPSQMVVTPNPPVEASALASSSAAEEQEGEGKKQRKRKAESGLAASAAKKPVAMAGQMAAWQRKHDELHADNAGPVNATTDLTAKSDVSKAPIKISLSTSTKVGFPNATKQPSPSNSSSEKERSSRGPPSPPPPSQQPNSGDCPASQEETYLDKERLMCLICMRKYKSIEEVNIHEKSRNHKTAMEDEDKAKAALPRLAARDKRLGKQGQGDETQVPQYRDRAKERRDIYNQPDRPVPSAAKTKGEGTKKTVEDADKPAKPVPSKGAGMLAKMGWTTGSGLGADGGGRTEAIETNAYQSGVGLGAEGGNLGDAVELAEKKTKNHYSDYLNTAQDKARERYRQMN